MLVASMMKTEAGQIHIAPVLLLLAGLKFVQKSSTRDIVSASTSSLPIDTRSTIILQIYFHPGQPHLLEDKSVKFEMFF